MLNSTATFKQARLKSVPLIAINTSDPAETILGIRNVEPDATPLIEWTITTGFRCLNDAGKEWVSKFQSNDAPILELDAALDHALQMYPGTIVFFHNVAGHLDLRDANSLVYTQGIWNLRDKFKANKRTLVLLAPFHTLPDALENDVLVIDEPLPDDEALLRIITGAINGAKEVVAGYPSLTEAEEARAVDALRGLNAFSAEQAVALSLQRTGLDLLALWERKREKIRQTPGLQVFESGENFGSVGGCEGAKGFLRRLISGRANIRCIVFIDEIEKAMAGASGDTSGVSQEMHGTLLQFMENNRSSGTLFLGHPGTAKSAIAKATGNEAGVLTIAFDLSGMKAGIVGQSNQNLSRALKVIQAISGGNAYFIATCNNVSTLSPELKRRFKEGTFFFDLPTKEERSSIWKIKQAKYGLTDDSSAATVSDEGWTGAEIETCCELAYKLNITIAEVASCYIVPMCQSNARGIQALRQSAHGKYLAASYAGVYVNPTAAIEDTQTIETLPENTKRAIGF